MGRFQEDVVGQPYADRTDDAGEETLATTLVRLTKGSEYDMWRLLREHGLGALGDGPTPPGAASLEDRRRRSTP